MKIPVFLSTTIVCPECQHMIEKLPPGMEEAISNGDLLRCSNCKSWLIVHIEVAKQSFDWIDEAAEHSVEQTGEQSG